MFIFGSGLEVSMVIYSNIELALAPCCVPHMAMLESYCMPGLPFDLETEMPRRKGPDCIRNLVVAEFGNDQHLPYNRCLYSMHDALIHIYLSHSIIVLYFLYFLHFQPAALIPC